MVLTARKFGMMPRIRLVCGNWSGDRAVESVFAADASSSWLRDAAAWGASGKEEFWACDLPQKMTGNNKYAEHRAAVMSFMNSLWGTCCRTQKIDASIAVIDSVL